MNTKGVTVLSLLLLCVVTICSCQFSIEPESDALSLPDPTHDLNIFTFIICFVEPTGIAVETRWILPDSTVIPTGGSGDIRSSYEIGSGSLLLFMTPVSYENSGTYMCEVRNMTDPWISATIDVQFRVDVQVPEDRITVDDTESEVELSCEMTNYIRPDEDLQWVRDGEVITDAIPRHTVTYTNGMEDAAQNGGTNLVPGRIAVLTISDPEQTDSGMYTCMVQGTAASVDVQLTVQAGQLVPTTVGPVVATTLGPSIPTAVQPEPTGTAFPSDSSGGDDSGSEFPLPAVIGGIAGFLGIIVVVLVVVIVVVSLRKRTSAIELLSENGAYESTNGGRKPVYAKITKSISPPPPIPARPPTNMTNSMNSIDFELPGYDIPDVNIKDRRMSPMKVVAQYEDPEASGNYDPYYDNPDEINARVIPPTKGHRKYYDEVEPLQAQESMFGGGGGSTGVYDMRFVPSPAAILNGSLQRQMDQKNPDFAYPKYNDGFSEDCLGDPDYDQIYSEPINPTMLNHEYELDSGSGEFEAVPFSAIYEDPKPLQNAEAPLLVVRDNIIEVRKLGTGQFGHVILAKTRGLSLKDMRLSDTDTDKNRSTLVAIKKLKPDAETGLMEAFDKEVKFMSRLNHDNVVRLIGVCTSSDESFIMMEYMENGDLNQFLQKQKLMPDTISGLQENEVTPIILLYMGVQIASGMHYLASRKFVHRDLATRNCLVGKDFIVKISDFGMSRSLYESAYYRVQGTLVLPIRWMACETFYGKFSVKSDSWAFGVSLWELYTLGKTDPYDYMTDEEVIADSIRGPDRKILERPEACSQDVYDIMQRCWVSEPSMRADFGEIYSRLFMIYTRQAL